MPLTEGLRGMSRSMVRLYAQAQSMMAIRERPELATPTVQMGRFECLDNVFINNDSFADWVAIAPLYLHY